MKYTVYNKDKNSKFGLFEMRDAVFTRSSVGRIIRMLLAGSWYGDKIAIVPEDWDDAKDAAVQDVVFASDCAGLPEIVETDDEYVVYGWGAFYGYTKNGQIDRFDDLIALIAINSPIPEPYYTNVNGKWAFKPLYVSNDISEMKDNLSGHYDTESFYRCYDDDVIYMAFADDEDIPDEGFWATDLMARLDEAETDSID